MLLQLLLSPAVVLADDAVSLRPPDSYFFQQTLGDFREELQRAREEGKQGVMLFFEQADCPFCARMKNQVLNRADVQDYFRKHFLIFAVDIDGDTEVVDFDGSEMLEKDLSFRRNRVRATPVLAFFDLQGRRVTRYTGATRDAEEMLLLGHYVVGQVYKKMSFARYKRQQRVAQSTAVGGQ